MKSAHPKKHPGTKAKGQKAERPEATSQPSPESYVADDPASAVGAVDFLELLIRHDYVTPASALMIRRFMSRWGVSAFEALLTTGIMDEATYANAVSSVLKIDRLYHLATLRLAEDTLEFFTFQRARDWLALPLRAEGAAAGRLEVVLADPTQHDRIEEIKRGLKREFTLAVADRGDMVRAIDELYPLAAQLPSLLQLPQLPKSKAK